jgi:hypothetical protein
LKSLKESAMGHKKLCADFAFSAILAAEKKKEGWGKI